MASSPRIVSLFPLRRRRLACEADRRRLADELQSQEDDIENLGVLYGELQSRLR